MADVIKLQSRVTENNDFTASDSVNDATITDKSLESKDETSLQQRISTKDLYPLRSEFNPKLSTAVIWNYKQYNNN